MSTNSTNNKFKSTYNKTVWLYFIMSILVMYIHANNLRNVGLDNSHESLDWILTKILSNGIGNIVVPFFFMIAGLHFFTFRNDEIDIKKEIKRKVLRRMKTLFVPYILWNIICYAFYFVLTHTALVNLLNDTSVVELSINNLLYGIFLHKYNYPFWYLRDLILFTLFSPLIYCILTRKWLSELMLILLALSSIFVRLDISGLFFFVLGGFLAFYHYKFMEKRHDNYAEKCLCVIILLAMIIFNYLDYTFVYNVLLLASPISVWIITDSIVFPKEKWFIKQSFFIYACHVIPVSIVMKILAKISIRLGGSTICAIAYLITPWVTLLIIYFIAKILNKFLPSLYKVLSGGR